MNGHLTPERAIQIVEENQIGLRELSHVETCSSCNGWLRAFAAVAISKGRKFAIRIPPEPAGSKSN
jgi:hypothetical protein